MDYPKDARGYVLTEYKEDALKESVLAGFAMELDSLKEAVANDGLDMESSLDEEIAYRKREIEMEHDGEDISEDELTELMGEDDELIAFGKAKETSQEWHAEFSRIADFDDFLAVMNDLEEGVVSSGVHDWLIDLQRLDRVSVADEPRLADDLLLPEEIAALESGSWRISDDGIEAF
jgi:hypothetical protein